MWYCKNFNELTTEELFIILKERVAVFVVEQNCPYQEIDENDLIAKHLFQKDDQDLVAYCRIIPTNDIVKLGRILVTKNYRNKGKGRHIVDKALTISQKQYPNRPIFVQAQSYLKDFYDSFGFQATSKSYLEDGIPHIDMILTRKG